MGKERNVIISKSDLKRLQRRLSCATLDFASIWSEPQAIMYNHSTEMQFHFIPYSFSFLAKNPNETNKKKAENQSIIETLISPQQH